MQFKFGDCYQHHYEMGQRLLWGGNDRGRSGLAKVVAKGIGESCPECGEDTGDFDVLIQKDVIVAVTPSSGQHDFTKARRTFLIIEE